MAKSRVPSLPVARGQGSSLGGRDHIQIRKVSSKVPGMPSALLGSTLLRQFEIPSNIV